MTDTKNRWLRLDNSAKIYPMLVTKFSQNLFSISAELNDDVDPELLGQALKEIMPRFPGMNVKLVRGLFWYYFEQNPAEPEVYEETEKYLAPITYKGLDGFNFRIMYYKTRITADFFHVICDGYGAMEFFKCLLFTYFGKCGYAVKSEQKILTLNTPVTTEETEDSFNAYYVPKKLSELKIKELQGAKAFHVPGELMTDGSKGVIIANMPIKQALGLAKSHGVSLTVFLTGLLMYSFYGAKVHPGQNPDSIQMFVPINLRRLFPSKSLRNFTLFSRIGAEVDKEGLTLEYFLDIAKRKLAADMDKELLSDKISTTVKAEKFFPMRVIPLFLKKLVFKISNLFFGKNKKTATFSNLGIADIPESFRPYVKNFWCGINCSKKTPLNISAVTTYDTLSVSFTRMITDTEVEKFFVRYLTSHGVEAEVMSNYRELAFVHSKEPENKQSGHKTVKTDTSESMDSESAEPKNKDEENSTENSAEPCGKQIVGESENEM